MLTFLSKQSTKSLSSCSVEVFLKDCDRGVLVRIMLPKPCKVLDYWYVEGQNLFLCNNISFIDESGHGDMGWEYWYVVGRNLSFCIISLIEDRDHGVVGWDNTSQYLVQLLRAALLATASVWGICISIKMAQMCI